MLDKKHYRTLMIFTHNCKDPITKDVDIIKNYFFHGNTVHSFDTSVVKYLGLLFSLNMLHSSKMYIYISFEMLDKKH